MHAPWLSVGGKGWERYGGRMENSMIERVATALMAETARQIRAGEEPALGNNPRLLARAAIEAMRDRDEAMLDAGTAVLWPYVQTLAPGSASVAVWKAMIDAALGKVLAEETFVPIPTPFMQHAKPPRTPGS